MQLRSLIQSQANSQHAGYHLAIEEKIKCYPTEDSKTVTGKCAEIKLQTSLDSTVQKLVYIQWDVLTYHIGMESHCQ
jgi:hypothetical protein